MTEQEIKLERARGLMQQHSLAGLLLERVSSFAWGTCGASSYINTASSFGESALLITADRQYVLTNNIEAPRLEREEGLLEAGWELRIQPWYGRTRQTEELAGGGPIGADGPVAGGCDLSDEVAHLRASLTPQEGDRFRGLAAGCARIMDRAVRSVRPGMSEFQIAALLAGQTLERGILPTVNLIACDERIRLFRHPLPSHKKLERIAMLVLCGRQNGLVCSITRLVHFGRLPDELRQKSWATAQVDAAMIAATRPGVPLGEVFARTIEAYTRCGYPDEWKLHHQGGAAGYEPREVLANPDNPFRVAAGQAYAWNPSITGTKSEDTILVAGGGNEVITKIEGWPLIEVEVEGRMIERPAILEVT